jgi:hypothetical protein
MTAEKALETIGVGFDVALNEDQLTSDEIAQAWAYIEKLTSIAAAAQAWKAELAVIVNDDQERRGLDAGTVSFTPSVRGLLEALDSA